MRRLIVTSVVLALALGPVGTLAAVDEPSAGTFSPAGSLAQARTEHTATALADGRVLVVGGAAATVVDDSLNVEAFASAEVWDPATTSFRSADSLSEADLAVAFPAVLDGRPFEVRSFSGPEWIAHYESPEGAELVDDLVVATGKTIDDLTIATALHVPSPGNHATVTAVHVRGAEAGEFVDPAIKLILGDIASPELESTSLSGRRVIRVRDASIPGTYPRTVYAFGDTVWLVEAERPLLGEILAGLPVAPTAGTFSPTGSMAVARAQHTATALPDGRVLVVGGFTGTEAPASTEVWDPATDTFSPTGSLAEARTEHTATTLPDGRVLVVGGASAEVWDPATGTFSPTGSLAEARDSHTATALADGRVLVVGGNGGGSTNVEPLASAEVWDPATGTFSPTGSLAGVRRSHGATVLPDGRVLVVGGFTETEALASAEVWDPATGTFSPAGSMAEERVQHTVTALPDGRVLVVGGASAEVWDPATGTFSPAGSLAEGRIQHTATALADGRVLVVGGSTVYEQFASAEVWEPSDG